MPKEAPELSMAQEDGAQPATLSAGGALSESGVSVRSARFEGAIHIRATSRRRDHLLFSQSDQLRYQRQIDGLSLSRVVRLRLERANELVRDGQSGLAKIAASIDSPTTAVCRVGFGAFTASPPRSSRHERR
jgi:hypothetical protein